MPPRFTLRYATARVSGKARSRWNALRHGVLAQATPVAEGDARENVLQFQCLVAQLRQRSKIWFILKHPGAIQGPLKDAVSALLVAGLDRNDLSMFRVALSDRRSAARCQRSGRKRLAKRDGMPTS